MCMVSHTTRFGKAGDGWEMWRRCVRDVKEMSGRCEGDYWEMWRRLVRDVKEMSERCKERCEGDEWEVWGRFFTSLAHLSLISFTSLHCIQKYSVSSSAIIAIWLHWKLHNANRTPINQLVSSMIIKQHTSNRIRTSLHASVRLYIHAWHPVHWTSRVSMIHSVRISVHTLGALADSCSQLCGVSAFLATENSPLSALSMTHCLADCSFKK